MGNFLSNRAKIEISVLSLFVAFAVALSIQPAQSFTGLASIGGDSCQDKCGGFAGSCWCDATCVNAGDCCSDYSLYCSGPPAPPSSCNNDADCNTPPSGFCNGTYRIWYNSSGACTAGTCNYQSGEIYCENGCLNGNCIYPSQPPTPNPSPQPSTNSCQDKCGLNAGNCYCDPSCVSYGDCCSDYNQYCSGTSNPNPPPPPPASTPASSQTGSNSCQNKCGGNAGSCWCDLGCVQFGDCCSDYNQYCSASTPPASPEPAPQPIPVLEYVNQTSPNSCAEKCGQNAGNCWCDSGCVSYGDCCSDYSQICAQF